MSYLFTCGSGLQTTSSAKHYFSIVNFTTNR